MIRVNRYKVSVMGKSYYTCASNKQSAKRLILIAFEPFLPPRLEKLVKVDRI